MRFPVLLLLAAALLVAGAQANGSSHGSKSKNGDGYNKPYSSTALWSYYKFDVLNKDFEFTSTRYMPDTQDPTVPGTIATVMGSLYDKNGVQIGINQWSRIVVGDDPDLSQDTRVVRSLIQVVYEFGSAADGYWDDTLSVTVVSKRPVEADANFVDYDAIITGGTGKFLGATGRMTISDAIFEDGNLVVASGIVRFDVFVPRGLPKMAP